MLDLYEASIAQLRDALLSHEFTSIQLTRAYLKRIEEVNPHLKAFNYLNPKALDEAAECDRRIERGEKLPLLGIPIGIKDNICTADMPTTAGFIGLKNAYTKEDAPVVNSLKKAGAVILGKTCLSEWAYYKSTGILPSGWASLHGQALSPYGLRGNPSGSSSGSGIAPAVGLCAAALGTETFGSVVSPASQNNLVGLRTAVGLLDGHGVIPISSHHDTVGPMTRSVHDAATLLEALTGKQEYVAQLDKNSLKGSRIGIIKQHTYMKDWRLVERPAWFEKVWEEALHDLKRAGAEVVELDVPDWAELMEFGDDLSSILDADFKAELPVVLEQFNRNPNNIRTLQDVIRYNEEHQVEALPTGYPHQDCLLRCQGRLDRDKDPDFEKRFQKYHEQASHFLTNAMNANDLAAIACSGSAYLAFSKAQTSYITVPMGFMPDETEVVIFKDKTTNESYPLETWSEYPGQPTGLILAAEPFSEAKLLSLAYAYEQATQHRLRRKAVQAATPAAQIEG